MKRQFATALSAPVTNQLFLSSWNEFIAQPQPNPFHSTNAFAMGLPSDPERSNLWVDTYGTAIGRDIAPSVQGGSVVFDTMQSCLRVLFLNNGSAAGCSVSNELCCTADPVADLWQPVWSLQRSDGTDFLVTAAANEFHDLIDSKWGSEGENQLSDVGLVVLGRGELVAGWALVSFVPLCNPRIRFVTRTWVPPSSVWTVGSSPGPL